MAASFSAPGGSGQRRSESSGASAYTLGADFSDAGGDAPAARAGVETVSKSTVMTSSIRSRI